MQLLEHAGIEFDAVVLPITDPYTRHHGALGSIAWLYLPEAVRQAAVELIRGLPGIEDVIDGDRAAADLELPRDRIGDLTVTADARTVLGSRAGEHDLSQLHGRLRSHDGPHERVIPLITSGSPPDHLAQAFRADQLRNRDIHDLVPDG